LIGYDDFNKTSMSKILAVPLMLFTLMTVTTPWTKLLFYIDENGAYRFGSLHFLATAVMSVYVVTGIAFLIIYRNNISRLQLVSALIFTLGAALGMYIQKFFFPNMSVGMAVAALTVIMLNFSVQTPDSYQLMRTMEELKKAKKQAEDAKKAKELFLANMSHEIRTPINSILGMNEMIIHKSTDHDILKYAETARKSGVTLLTMINNVLDHTKLSTGELELSCEPFESRTFFEIVIDEGAAMAKEKGLYFKANIPTDFPRTLQGDSLRIRQILQNFISNAVKFTSEGGVTFTAKYKSSGASTITAEFSVSDTGCGMEKQDTDRIFQSFVRLNSAGNYSLEGAGLGLSVSAELAEIMHGRIDVDSESGIGSTFTFTLDIMVKDSAPAGEIFISCSAGESRHGGGVNIYAPEARVLAADDCEVNLFIITELLKQFGIHADIAASGDKCIELAAETAYDLIIVDHMMPPPDGIEVLHTIKETAGFASSTTPVVVLTANAVVGAREQYINEGFDGYMSKPVTFKALSDILVKFLPEQTVQYTADISADGDVFSNVNLAHIDIKGAVKKCGSMEVYTELLRNFAGSTADYAARLEKAAESKSTAEYAEISARVKKEAAEIGAANLSDMAKLQEMFAGIGRYEDVISLHRDFVNTLVQVTAEAEKNIIGKTEL
ncbi:MAG: ATP-binding protein, partial [Oscillospiraceae bacterium]